MIINWFFFQVQTQVETGLLGAIRQMGDSYVA